MSDYQLEIENSLETKIKLFKIDYEIVLYRNVEPLVVAVRKYSANEFLNQLVTTHLIIRNNEVYEEYMSILTRQMLNPVIT